jgi:hypothetical protein
VIILSAVTQAQNSLTHNTGTLEVTTIENGYIGNDHSGMYGGVVFNGNQNAMPGSAGAGLIFGRNGEGHGNYGSIFEEFYNDIPIAGFFPHTFFTQYAYYTVALTGDPDSKTFMESFSNTGHDFVFLRATLSDNTTNIDDIYPGIFADWDVGNFNLNRGGYDNERNLFYMYENGGAGDASYYGIMGIAIDGVPMAPNAMRGTITDSIAWNYWALYDLMTSTVFDTITTDGDYRMYSCFGPFSFPAGSTLVVDVAIVAGTSLSDLLANADDAISYWEIVPVENEINNQFSFVLGQNYPNPFNPITTIKFQIPEMSFTMLKVYDVLGNELTTLVNEEKPVGIYEIEFDSHSGSVRNLPSGVYFYRLQAGNYIETKKMVLMK